jgi:hypothetical protein
VGAPEKATTISPTSSTPRSASDPVHGGGRIDLRTGEVWPQAAVDYAREQDREDPDDEDPHRWLPVWCEGSIEGISDRDRADRLSIVISGRGAFRRFKDVLEHWARRARGLVRVLQRGRARAWLAAAGYSPRPAGRPMTR